MGQNLRVSLRRELVAMLNKKLPQHRIVLDYAVVDDGDPAAGI